MDTLVVRVTDPDALPCALQGALDILRRGGLVAFPTDTVYGLGALAHEPGSIERLYAVKGRDASKAIPILISALSDLNRIAAEIDERARRLAEKYWPGPLTLVVPRHPSLPDELTPYPTVGVRMPDHPIALGLIRLTGPLAVTSANLSGQSSSVTADEVLDQLQGSIELVLDGGETPGGISSTVVDCSKPDLTVLRQGPITMEEIRSVLMRGK